MTWARCEPGRSRTPGAQMLALHPQPEYVLYE